MFLVVGLGNPGARYEKTRHNLGFRVADALVEARPGLAWRDKFQSSLAEFEAAGSRCAVMKPQTFMNRSGEAVGRATSFYKVETGAVVVVHDELDLPLGDVRIKVGGGEAGHNGLRSISQHLGSRDYVRLRVGIGRPPPEFRGDTADFVLQAVPPEVGAHLPDIIQRACGAIGAILERGVESAMNETNRKK